MPVLVPGNRREALCGSTSRRRAVGRYGRPVVVSFRRRLRYEAGEAGVPDVDLHRLGEVIDRRRPAELVADGLPLRVARPDQHRDTFDAERSRDRQPVEPTSPVVKPPVAVDVHPNLVQQRVDGVVVLSLERVEVLALEKFALGSVAVPFDVLDEAREPFTPDAEGFLPSTLLRVVPPVAVTLERVTPLDVVGDDADDGYLVERHAPPVPVTSDHLAEPRVQPLRTVRDVGDGAGSTVTSSNTSASLNGLRVATRYIWRQSRSRGRGSRAVQ
jgi:hypothetical protein